MFNIKDFFAKIEGAQAREMAVRESVREAIKKHSGLEVPLETISFNSGTAVLKNIGQTARSVIFIKKVAILDDVNAAQSLRKVTDLR